MTTASTNTPAPTRPRSASGPGAGSQTAQIDPVKLLKKYWIALAATVVFAAALGVVAHILWMKTYPFYRATVIFQCLPKTAAIGDDNVQVDADEFERFMNTQAQMMVSKSVLTNAARNPRVQSDLPVWAAKFTTNGVYDDAAAAIWLEENISARPVTQTEYIELRTTWKKKSEVAPLIGFVKTAYEDALRDLGAESMAEKTEALNDEIAQLEDSIETMQQRRDDLLTAVGADSTDTKVSEARSQLQIAQQSMSQISIGLDEYQSRLAEYEAELASPAGNINYPEDLRDAVDRDPLILNIKQQINNFRQAKAALEGRGLGPNHRDVIRLRNFIDGTEKTLQSERETLLRTRFDSLIKSFRSQIAAFKAQEVELAAEIDGLRLRLQELAAQQKKIDDIDMKILLAQQSLAEQQLNLSKLQTVGRTAFADRVRVYQAEREPTEVWLPKWYIVVPAMIVLLTGIVGGLVTVRELTDQRVKGPSDIAMLPRTKVLGTIPHASFDPSSPAVVETAFRDEPKGVLAESYRQARAALLERMREGGHKTLLVASAAPGAGGTSLVANLGVAAASADLRVLIVDANLRRPAMHRVLGLEQQPGLTDVLSGNVSLESAIQNGGTPGLSVLTSGSMGNGGFERLASEKASEIAAKVRDDYDLVLIDAPPVIVSGDAMALANRADAAILVVRAYEAKRGLVGRVRNEIGEQSAEFLGVIVNAVRPAAGGYFRKNIRATHEYQNG
jgi:capsular exopolysaccharide synthesis family protein